jgi:AcrR family transcriptional regulator
VALILEKGYEAVTVQDILDRANLGRSTFYTHFHDKGELLFGGFLELMAEFETGHKDMLSMKTPSGHDDLSLALFRHVEERRHLFKAMLGKQSGEMAVKQAHKYLTTYMRRHLKAAMPDDKQAAVPLDVTTHFLVSSFLSLLIWWLDHNLPYTADEMDAMYRQLALPGVMAVLGVNKFAE